MIVTRTGRPRIVECWFDEPLPTSGADVVVFRQYTHRPEGVPADPFRTLVIDLSRTEAEIFAAMRSGTRNEVRRDPAKDGLTTEMIERPTSALIAEFAAFYRRFAAGRDLVRVKTRWLEAMALAGSLQLTRAAAHGDTVVWHSYMTRPDRVRLLHSVSLHRGADGSVRNMTGRANRLLHWRDIVWLRERGVRTYDLGGVYDGQDASLLAINHFKEGFGGVRVTEYSGTFALTWFGQGYLALKRHYARWRR
jgi:lipid II:glycine glycyltransferase (peptidoglycan interpeptide bridge formation enzyme)